MWLGVHYLRLDLLEEASIISACITPSLPRAVIKQPLLPPQYPVLVTCWYVHILPICGSVSHWLPNCSKGLWIATASTSPGSSPPSQFWALPGRSILPVIKQLWFLTMNMWFFSQRCKNSVETKVYQTSTWTAIGLPTSMFGRNQCNAVKQLSFN